MLSTIGHLLVDILHVVQHIHGIVENSLNGDTVVLSKPHAPFLRDATLRRSCPITPNKGGHR
jgi:hypothetical protein